MRVPGMGLDDGGILPEGLLRALALGDVLDQNDGKLRRARDIAVR